MAGNIVLAAANTCATAASQARLRKQRGAGGAVVVGVGYPDPNDAMRLRNFDLTPSEPLPGQRLGPEARPGDFGGAALFHRFKVEELRPAIASMASVDPAKQSLIGCSLGGLFALGVLFLDETHLTSIPATISRRVAFTFMS